MIRLAALLLALFAAAWFAVTYSPDDRGWKTYSAFDALALARTQSTAPATAETILYVEVLEEPAYNWPLASVSIPGVFNSHDLTYLAKAHIRAQYGSPVTLEGPFAVETHGTLRAGHRYLLSLDSSRQIIDAYPATDGGMIQLIDETNSAPATLGGNVVTEPMSPQDAANQLLGKPPLVISNKFWP